MPWVADRERHTIAATTNGLIATAKMISEFSMPNLSADSGPGFSGASEIAQCRPIDADEISMNPLAISFDLWDDPEAVWALLGSVGAAA
jgi:hypothetical protein